uniref:Uncharacterized protein n=1 Tax=Sphaeramia orbicularis TaxID=375764 RepID=A0A673AN77_9TELE
MHVPVRRLLLPVQRLLQHQLRELIPVRLRLHVQVEVVVGGALQGEAGSRCGALGDLNRDVGLREAGRVVVNIHHFDFHPKQLQGVLQKHFHVELAAGALLTDLLPVDFLVRRPVADLTQHSIRGDAQDEQKTHNHCRKKTKQVHLGKNRRVETVVSFYECARFTCTSSMSVRKGEKSPKCVKTLQNA